MKDKNKSLKKIVLALFLITIIILSTFAFLYYYNKETPKKDPDEIPDDPPQEVNINTIKKINFSQPTVEKRKIL